MSADHVRAAHSRRHVDDLLPPDSAELLTPRAAAYFGLPESALLVTQVSVYADGSGAILSFGTDPAGGAHQQRTGRADHVFVSVVSSDTEPRDHSLDAVREEYDHPGVRIVPLDSPGWTYAYSAIVDAGSLFIGGAVTRFVKIDGTATLAVAFRGVNGPLDHAAARAVADDVLAAVGWSDGGRLSCLGM
ncbi:MAG: hypothetical protein ACTHVY_00810 [Brevibacterium yomogidense]|uniref:Uncharacterized protein n=1 Tax=Brevibacterium yomogidense TaxID=946573 RepID=A0A1X6XKN9_9MICO|nr:MULTISPECIES: hypothetical protein [Brevibacterium]SLM99690.1 hypothetical protein FM105_11645 [Brevibacterium yomogidense]SMX69687.1 hypothetical protein BSP109_00696 [Brevibacterium sp. Mu109]